MRHLNRTSWLARAVLALFATPLIVFATVQPASAAVIVLTAPATNAQVDAAMESLQPGDTLQLSGTFDVGQLDVAFLNEGTAASPITITAVDPNTPPLIRGFVIFKNPVFVKITDIKFEATVSEKEAMRIAGGNNWSVSNSQFTGAAATYATANVVIENRCLDYAGDPACVPPTNWKFTYNCVHHAGVPDPDDPPLSNDQRFHNVYVNSQGPSLGYISRNIMYSAALGAHVKVGRGSAGNPTGPNGSDVRVRYNTFHSSKRGVIIVGEVYGTDVRYNLFKTGTQEGSMIHASTIPLTGSQLPNKVAYNYYRDVPLPAVDIEDAPPYGALAGTYQAFGNVGQGVEPNFDGSGCLKYHPAAAVPAQYGRYSTANGTGL